MTLTKETIKHIEANGATYINGIEELEDRVAVLPGESKVVDLEKYGITPRRMRQDFRTSRIHDFIRYMKEESQSAHGDSQTAVFVDPAGGGARGVIDYGTHNNPLWGDHRATLALQDTPAWKETCRIEGASLPQRDLTDYLEDWGHILTPWVINDDGTEEEVTMARAVSAIRSVTISAQAETDHDDGDFSVRSSAISSLEGKSKRGQIPARFTLRTPLYEGTRERDVSLSLRLLTGHDKPTFRVRVVGRDPLIQEVIEEVELRIAEEMVDLARVFVGNI